MLDKIRAVRPSRLLVASAPSPRGRRANHHRDRDHPDAQGDHGDQREERISHRRRGRSDWPRPKEDAMVLSPYSAPLATLLERVREHYRDEPGLTLTQPQATRLFGVAPSVCAAMFRAFVMEDFLSRCGDGLFVRSTHS
jgi:hypothetical protein